MVLLGGSRTAELFPIDCGDFCKGGCGDRDINALGLVDGAGEEVRCTGLRPTGGTDFLDVVLVDEIEERRSLDKVMLDDGRLGVETVSS